MKLFDLLLLKKMTSNSSSGYEYVAEIVNNVLVISKKEKLLKEEDK